MPPMIYTLKTIDKQEYPVDIDPDVTTTDALADLVAQKYNLDKSLMTLIHVGKILRDNKKLSEFGIADEPQKNFGVLLLKKATTPKLAPAPEPAPVPEPAAEAMEVDMPSAAPAAEVAPAAAAPAADVPAAAAVPDVPAAPAAAVTAESAGGQMSEAVANICAMGFEQSQVEVALQAAYGNPDRAVEYLFDPSSMPAQQPQMPAPAAMPANPAAAMPANPAADGAMPAGMPPMTPEMAQMMQSPQLQGMMQAIQQNPAMLQQVIQQIQQTNPDLMQTIAQNQDAFMAMLAGGAGGMGAAAGGDAAAAAGGQGQPPPGAIMVTVEEKQALENLEALFPAIDRAVIFQTYKACGGDEQLTSNLLMDNAADFMMDDDAPAGGNQ